MSNVTVEQALQIAEGHLQGGRVAEAEAICQQILAAFPEQPGALHLLAGVALAVGKPTDALAWLDRSLAADPTVALRHMHRGTVLYALERREESGASHVRALELQPDLAEAHYWLGRMWREAGEVDLATNYLQRAVELAPQWAAALKELGKALLGRRRLQETGEMLERALASDPNDADTHNIYATLMTMVNQMDRARQHLFRAVELDPNHHLAVDNLGFALSKVGRLDEARRYHERALEIRPGYASAYNNLGFLYRNLMQPEKGLEYSRLAVAAMPENPEYGSDLVMATYYHPGVGKKEVGAELRAWNERHAAPLRVRRQPHTNDRDPERRLRVGYVSPDFHIHVVSNFTVPLLEAHDPAQVETHCYASVQVPDMLTARLRRTAHAWHDVRHLGNLELVDAIRADGIDVLVDLSVHSGGNRLQTFACRPAPVQVSWLGFAGSTGLETMDYRLTDPQMDPPGEDESWSSETPVRLPDCWCCFEPMQEDVPVAALPALRNGYVTFGSLNGFMKINAPTLRLWARALGAVAGSRLLLHAPENRESRALMLGVLAEAGVGAERVEFVGWQPGLEYLRTYDRIDVGLDPFPFNGMTTTCDAMWRGVPVLSLPGELPTSRAGLSLLTVVGLEVWVARDEEEYARKARELTANLGKLQRLRAGLRRRMRESALMDAPRFARNVEREFRGMWRRWCAGRGKEEG